MKRDRSVSLLKDKLVGIREKVKEGIADTSRTIANIDAFGKGMREATQQMANAFRTFADKEEVDYSHREKKFSKTELAKKLWQWQKKVYESSQKRKIYCDVIISQRYESVEEILGEYLDLPQ